MKGVAAPGPSSISSKQKSKSRWDSKPPIDIEEEEKVPKDPIPWDDLSEDDPSKDGIQGYKPFSKDKDKQKRYELYLRMKEKGMAGW